MTKNEKSKFPPSMCFDLLLIDLMNDMMILRYVDVAAEAFRMSTYLPKCLGFGGRPQTKSQLSTVARRWNCNARELR